MHAADAIGCGRGRLRPCIYLSIYLSWSTEEVLRAEANLQRASFTNLNTLSVISPSTTPELERDIVVELQERNPPAYAPKSIRGSFGKRRRRSVPLTWGSRVAITGVRALPATWSLAEASRPSRSRRSRVTGIEWPKRRASTSASARVETPVPPSPPAMAQLDNAAVPNAAGVDDTMFCMSPETRHTEPLAMLVSVPACWLEAEQPPELPPGPHRGSSGESLNQQTTKGGGKTRQPRFDSHLHTERDTSRSAPVPITGSTLANDCPNLMLTRPHGRGHAAVSVRQCANPVA